MKRVIEYIDTKGMFPNPDSGYLVAWDDEERGRIMIGFSYTKDLSEDYAHISYSYETFYKDPIGKLNSYLYAFIDMSRALEKFAEFQENKEK